MTGPDHYREAERIAAAAKSQDRAHREGFSFWERGELAALAQVHATLALFDQVREIGDQLDTLPRKSGLLTEDDVMRCAHGAVICGLCGYGVPAGDGGRS